ncbi:MAG: protein kinase [Armatimonadota bacterium]|nr:protein kinase [Armatimonadota bacterium]MDW8144075.1 protein kinase [Armatimonadota bacterium]
MQTCPNCKQQNDDTAKFCPFCGEQQLGLLGFGTILQNRYRINDLLGCGGFGAVYQSTDIRLGVTVAVKENLQSQAEVAFLSEAKLLSTLKHPNLPKVINYFVEPNGRQYLVMEFVDGESLEKLVRRKGRLSEQEALTLLRGVFDAVTYLHSQSPPVIHRDIKPSNIIIQLDGRAVLVDFGIAKVGGAGVKTRTAGSQVGSPGFAPLEQYAGSGQTDERTDIYALAATLYFCLAGYVPPEAPDIAAGIRTLLPLRQFNPSVSVQVDTAIIKAMSVQKNLRYRSVDEFWQALTTPTVQPIPTHLPPLPSTVQPSSAASLRLRLIATWRTQHIRGFSGISIIFSPDSQHLATSSRYDEFIKIWRTKDGGLIRELKIKGVEGVTDFAFSPDSQFLAAICPEKIRRVDWVLLWRIIDGSLFWMVEDGDHPKRLIFSPDGQTLVSLHYDSIKLRRITDGGLMWESQQARECVFSPDGLHLVTVERIAPLMLDETIVLRRTVDGYPSLEFKHMGRVESVSFSPDRQLMASASRDYVKIWRVSDGTLIHTLKTKEGGHEHVCFSPDSQLLASWSSEYTIAGSTCYLWRVNDGTLIWTLPLRERATFTFSPDGQTLASVSHRIIRFWCVHDGTLIDTFEPLHDFAVFSPDWRYIVAAWYHSDALALYQFSR